MLGKRHDILLEHEGSGVCTTKIDTPKALARPHYGFRHTQSLGTTPLWLSSYAQASDYTRPVPARGMDCVEEQDTCKKIKLVAKHLSLPYGTTVYM